MQDFLHQYGSLITLLGVISTFTFFLSLLIIPWILCRLQDDFFLHFHEHTKKEDEHPVIFILLRLLRYFFGTLLVLAGILMIFLPGQGLLTIILGTSLLDFPGKQRLADIIIGWASVQRGLNWVREKGDKAPFSFPEK